MGYGSKAALTEEIPKADSIKTGNRKMRLIRHPLYKQIEDYPPGIGKKGPVSLLNIYRTSSPNFNQMPERLIEKINGAL